MHANVEHVTPQIAAAYLSKNTNNRPLNKGRVASYARAMERGEWQFNGDPIRFSEDDVLIDGQHRLSAIVQSNISQSILVIRNLPQQTFKTIDVGAARTAGDLAALAGIKNSNIVTSGARLFLPWAETGSIHVASDKRPTNSQILDFLDGNKVSERAGSYVAGSSFLRRFLTPSASCFLYLAFATRSEEKTVSFFDELKEPTEIKWDSPVFLLRERITQAASAKTRLRRHEVIAVSMKAFRFWCDGKATKQLKVATSGSATEKEIYRVK